MLKHQLLVSVDFEIFSTKPSVKRNLIGQMKFVYKWLNAKINKQMGMLLTSPLGTIWNFPLHSLISSW